MESIFSRSKDTPIRATIADYVSLLCYEKDERIAAHKKIRGIYDLRSEIVHSGKTKISGEFIVRAERVSAKALLESLKIFKSLEQADKPEEKFFDMLLEMKLS